VQADIADKVIRMLAGATRELRLGDPALLETDVGLVIDTEVMAMLEAHAERMNGVGKLLCQADLPQGSQGGHFFAPRAYEIASLDLLD
jgi:RHH-type proline utilization regulon transcriptional repressor/proline dehydrogenase/delta 1-pyrroline-5-carboxylate dehydrogenase